MKKLLCLLVIALPLAAATATGNITVPDAQAAGLATLIETWIQGQTDSAQKYPQATRALRRQALFDTFMRDAVRSLVQQACQQFPASCPNPIKTPQSEATTANIDRTAAIEALIQ